MNREKIEIRIVNGQHLAFYKGEVLPFLVKSTVVQDANLEKQATAILEFEVKLHADSENATFQITGGIISKTIDPYKTHVM